LDYLLQALPVEMPLSPILKERNMRKKFFYVLAIFIALLAGIAVMSDELDSDEDGLPDWWEWEYFGTLLLSGVDDLDEDGTNNLNEFINSTDPIDDLAYGLNNNEQEGGSGLIGTVRILNGNVVKYRSDLAFISPNSFGLPLSAVYNGQISTPAAMGAGWRHTYEVSINPQISIGESSGIKIIDQTAKSAFFIEESTNVYAGIFGELSSVEHLGNEYIWYRLDGTQCGFSDTTLKMDWIQDEKRNRLNIAYDQGRISTVTDDASGRILIFRYDGNDRLDYIEGPVTPAVSDGIWVTYGYDGNNNLTSVTYADGSGYTYLYEDLNDPNNLTGEYDKENHLISTWTYDVDDRCESSLTNHGTGFDITYVSESQVDLTDAYGVLRTYYLGRFGGREKVASMQGSGWAPYSNTIAVSWEYDGQSNLIEVEYANGAVNQYQNYDNRGNPQTVILAFGEPEQRTLNFTYHPDMNVPLTRSESSLLGAGNKVTILDYDDDYNTTPNENPTKLLCQVIEQGYTRDGSANLISYEYTTVINYNTKGQVSSIEVPAILLKLLMTLQPVTV